MKIALAQLNYHVGNFESNTAKIIQHIKKAHQNGADLVVFAELCVCGYPARDFLEFSEFISLCDDAAQKIAAACTDIACIIGLPTPNHKTEGKELSNSAYFIENGKIKAVVNKALCCLTMIYLTSTAILNHQQSLAVLILRAIK